MFSGLGYMPCLGLGLGLHGLPRCCNRKILSILYMLTNATCSFVYSLQKSTICDQCCHMAVEYTKHWMRAGLASGKIYFCLLFSPRGEWADPGGTARPGQPLTKSEQAPVSSSSCKNQFNIDGPQWGPYQILS